MWGRNTFRYFIKSISSETNNKFPSHDSLTAEFYKHFSNKLASILIDVYDFSGKLDTMGVTSKGGMSMILYIRKVIL